MGPDFYVFGFGWIVNIIILGLLITGTEFISKKFSGNHNRENALDIINKRYARGEITEKEYDTLKNEMK